MPSLCLTTVTLVWSAQINNLFIVIYKQEHPWVTYGGKHPLPTTEENCTVIEVTDDDIQNSVKSIPKIKTLVSIRFLLNHFKLRLYSFLRKFPFPPPPLPDHHKWRFVVDSPAVSVLGMRSAPQLETSSIFLV